MSSLGITVPQFIQSIKVEIQQIFIAYRMVYVHRSKLACLCADLLKFHKSLTAKHFDPKPATPTENKMFRLMIHELSEMRNLCASLIEESYLEIITSNPPNFVQLAVTNFRNRFNEYFSNLNISSDPPFVINPLQLSVDDCADLQDLLQHLKAAEQTPGIIDTITQVEEEISVYNNKNQVSYEILEQKDIDAALKPFSQWKVSHRDVKLQEKIGFGGFADVFSGYQKSTGRVVAIKRLHVKEFTEQNLSMFKREIQIFTNLHHFAVLPFVGFTSTSPFYLITEFMPGLTLYARLHSTLQPLDATNLTIIALGVALGMAYLHEKHMLHRDLKSLNVLLDADDFPRICDFGTSRLLDENSLMTAGVGTAQWMAPEVINTTTYGQKADVYSYGVMLWEMLTHDVPFRGMKDAQIADAVANQNRRPPIPPNCPPKLRKLVTLCWDRDPKNRPDFKTIAQAFMVHEISFPGTQMERVEAYLGQFDDQIALENASAEIAAASRRSAPTKELVSEIESLLSSSEASDRVTGVRRLRVLLPAHALVINSSLITLFVDAMEECQGALLASEVLEMSLVLINDKMYAPQLVNEHITAALLELFMKFGTTTMSKFVEVLDKAIELDPVKFSTAHFAKLATFLQATGLKQRLDMTKLLQRVIAAGSYSKEANLGAVVMNVLKNVIVGTVPELLEASLELLVSLTEIPRTAAQINKLEGAAALVPLLRIQQSSQMKERIVDDKDDAIKNIPAKISELDNIPKEKLAITRQRSKTEARITFSAKEKPEKSSKEKVLQMAFQVLKKLLSESQPTPKLITTFFDDFDTLVMSLPSEMNLRVQPIILASFLTRASGTFKEVTSNPSIVLAFQHMIQSKKLSEVACALKVAFQFLSSSVAFPAFSELLPILLPLLQHPNTDIQTLAAANLTVIFLNKGLESLDERVADYVSTQSIASLRLAGALSLSRKGAQFLSSHSLIKSLVVFLDSLPPPPKLPDSAFSRSNSSSTFNTGNSNSSETGLKSPEPISEFEKEPQLTPEDIDREKQRELAIAVIASESSSWPLCKDLIEAIPLVMKSFGSNGVLGEQAMTFAFNMSTVAQAAKILVGYIDQFVEILKNENGQDVYNVLTILRRLAETPEAKPELEKFSEQLEKVCEQVEIFWDSDFADITFDMIKSLLKIKNVKDSLPPEWITKLQNRSISIAQSRHIRDSISHIISLF